MSTTKPQLIALGLAFLLTSRAGAQASAVRPIVITHVNVIDVATAKVLPNRNVTIQGTRIRSVDVASTAMVADGARVIDGNEKYLIPGLWDMHVHAAQPGVDKLFLPVLVAEGVTGVREMFSRIEWVDSSRALVTRGDVAGPRIIGAGNLVDGTPPIWPGSVVARNADEAKHVVDSLVDRGAPFIKLYSRLTPEAFFAAGTEAKARGVPFVGHVPTLVGAGEASDAGMLTIEHLQQIVQACSSREEDLRAQIASAVASPGKWDSAGAVGRAQAATVLASFDAARCTALGKRFAKNGTIMIPTFSVLHSVAYLDDSTLRRDPRLKYIPPFFSAGWNPQNDFRFRMLTPADWVLRKKIYEKQVEIAKLLRRAGVQFLPGTDLLNPYVFPGFSLHDELASFVEIGFTTAQALRAATLDPARFFHATDSLGTVAAGKLADLVLLDANPLTDIHNVARIHTVVANGRVLGPVEREEILRKAANGGR